mgnify:CR=1 FL=1
MTIDTKSLFLQAASCQRDPFPNQKKKNIYIYMSSGQLPLSRTKIKGTLFSKAVTLPFSHTSPSYEPKSRKKQNELIGNQEIYVIDMDEGPPGSSWPG